MLGNPIVFQNAFSVTRNRYPAQGFLVTFEEYISPVTRRIALLIFYTDVPNFSRECWLRMGK